MIKKAKIKKLLFFIILSLLIYSCDFRELFPGIFNENINAYLIEVDSQGQYDTRTIYHQKFEPEDGKIEKIINSVLFEMNGELKVAFTKELYIRYTGTEDTNYYYDKTTYPIYNCGTSPSYEAEWPSDYYQTPMLSDEFWLVRRDLLYFSKYDNNWNVVAKVKNSYANDATNTLKDVVVKNDKFYLLFENKHAGYFVRITDMNLQNPEFIDLDSNEIVSNFILGPESISVITLNDVSYDGSELDFTVTENIFTTSGLTKKIIDNSLLPDLSDETYFFSDKNKLILFVNDDSLYCYDSETGSITGKLDRFYYANYSYNKNHVFQDTNEQIIIASYENQYDDNIGVKNISLSYYNSEFTLLKEIDIPLSGDYNKDVIGLYMNSNDKLCICTFGTY